MGILPLPLCVHRDVKVNHEGFAYILSEGIKHSLVVLYHCIYHIATQLPVQMIVVVEWLCSVQPTECIVTEPLGGLMTTTYLLGAV